MPRVVRIESSERRHGRLFTKVDTAAKCVACGIIGTRVEGDGLLAEARACRLATQQGWIETARGDMRCPRCIRERKLPWSHILN